MLDRAYFTEIHGAVYIPTKAWNAYQQWRDYSHEITDRDFGVCTKPEDQCDSVWMSYEFGSVTRKTLRQSLRIWFLVAFSKGIRVMPSMFECCGRDP
jgi:hypothetical protein